MDGHLSEGAVQPLEPVWERHPVLYHYTRFESFRSILTSQTLWAKYYTDLNDSTELHHLKPRLRRALIPGTKRVIKKLSQDSEARAFLKRQFRQYGSRAEVAEAETDRVLDGLFDYAFGGAQHRAMLPPYITSFCSHAAGDDQYVRDHGLLSMWRGYGADGGVAIVLNTKELDELRDAETYVYHYTAGLLDEVVYDGDDQWFDHRLGYFTQAFTDQIVAAMKEEEDLSKEGNQEFTDVVITGFFNAATHYKHRAFVEEREVRLAMSPWSDKAYASASEDLKSQRQRKLPFTNNSGTFIELFDFEDSGPLPIERVIIGPHPDQGERYREAKRLLRAHRGVDIACSETPYVPPVG